MWGLTLGYNISDAHGGFSQYFHYLLISDIVSCRMLTAIANLIGERGEMAKQPLPIFSGQWPVTSGQSANRTPLPYSPCPPTTLSSVLSHYPLATDHWPLTTALLYHFLLCQS
jgi:hypothetical protein